MVKYIRKLLNALKVEMALVWLMALLTVVLGELDVIPNGMVAPQSSDEVSLNIAAIVLTLVGIPLAIRLFSLNTTKGLRRMDNEEALHSYHVWSGVRMGILGLDAIFGMVVYYLATSVSGLFCALVALGVTIYCWPSGAKIASYLESVNNE